MSQWRAIDLFAGIGGFHYALERAGADIVFASEIDQHARMAYEANHKASTPELFSSGHFAGDITQVASEDVPAFDIIAGGFPCQAFSIAGVSKNNSLGRLHGFDDAQRRGMLFFEIARLIEHHQPAAFLLENVMNLRSHDGGKTFRVIREKIAELGYQLEWRIISSEGITAQRRKRIFLVGFREPTEWTWPATLTDAPDGDEGATYRFEDEGIRLGDILQPDSEVDDKYTLSDKLWNYLEERAAKNKAAGKGFGHSVFGPNDITRTISARYHKDGSEILVAQPGKNPRKLTPREALRLQGFPDSHEIVCSNTQTYRQAGNAVAVPVVERLARQLIATLDAAEWAKPVADS